MLQGGSHTAVEVQSSLEAEAFREGFHKICKTGQGFIQHFTLGGYTFGGDSKHMCVKQTL